MRKLLFYAMTFLLCIPAVVSAQPQMKGIANPQAVVSGGKDVRFTVLTSGVIRMEWSADGVFNDDCSFVVVNRDLPVPEFKAKKNGKWLTITTEKMVLRYLMNSGKFTVENLSVSSPRKASFAFSWKPGNVQKGNLKGTSRTLDSYNGDTQWNSSKKLPHEDGLLATDGWTLIDDSENFRFDNSDWPWVKPRTEKEMQDWYFMGYGRDYKGALKDFSLFAGNVPLPPRYAFGYWWSRYWAYSDKEIRQLVKNFNRFNVPLDVVVIDMDWHRIDSLYAPRDEFNQKRFWTGWTWNKDLLPDRSKLLGWLKTQKLKTTLNLHPASGIAPFEEQYQEFAKVMNFDTTTKRNIPYDGSNKKFMNTLFDVVLSPMEKDGVDFWWIDWQQWAHDKKIKGLSNTWWINYVFFTHMERNRNTRPLLYHRWGGLGNHRYQIGFSGDTPITWAALHFQPYFTNTSSNVLYGYWSHDIGGHTHYPHTDNPPPLDPELYTRWIQYGVFSPILRTHSTKDASLNKEIWNFRNDYFDAQSDAIRLRYTLVPYIYTMARDCYDTGISLVRPMYYDYPTAQEAYDFHRQYMFGDDIMISPIGEPTVDGFSTVKVWLPEGSQWFEWQTGTLLDGGQILDRTFSITEYPIYIRAGAVIPMYDGSVMQVTDQPEVVQLAVFPGANGAARMYEDNGNDKYYREQHAFTHFKSTRTANSLALEISPRTGSYAGMPETRTYEVLAYGSAMPSNVTVDGQKAEWTYIGESLCVKITLPQTNCDRTIHVKIDYPTNAPDVNDGLVAKFRYLTSATSKMKFRKANFVMPKVLGALEETSIKLEYQPENFAELIEYFKTNYPNIPQTLDELRLDQEGKEIFLKQIRFNN